MALRVVFAPDSFKGSIGAAAAAAALADGWRTVEQDVDTVVRPMADGGEGTLEAFEASVPGAQRIPLTVRGPLDEPVAASWLLLPPSADAPEGTGVVELACTAGIELLGTPPRLRPLDAHTVGFGQAVAAALDHGVSRLVLGIGGSASTDGGTGVLTALGARFTDAGGRPIPEGTRGLAALAAVDLSALRTLPAGGAVVLTDVTNPLTGPAGAATVFGPQKGLAGADAAMADAALARLAEMIGGDPAMPGAGAAGGVGYGLAAWGARLLPGAAEVATLIGLRAAVAAASVVVTGEGAFDGQSASGKVPGFVGALAVEAGVPAALVAGRIASDADTGIFRATVSLVALAGSSAAAMAEPARWLRAAGAVLARALREG